MRVMHVLHGLDAGGMERVTVQLATGLARRDHAQAICCLRHRGILAAELPADVALFEMNATSHDWKLPLRLRRLMRQWQPDVVHGLNWSGWPDAAIAARAVHGVSLVQTFHGFLEDQPLRRRLAGAVLRRMTQRVQAVSSALAEQVSTNFGVARQAIRVVPNGVDTERYDPGSRLTQIEEATGPRRLKVVTVGSLTAAKDPMLWLRVAEACRSMARFAWVGDGPLRHTLEREIDALRLTDVVSLPGHQSDVASHLSEADLYLCTSLREAAPLSVREAMAMGLPVISTPAGDVPELIEASGAGISTAGHQVASLVDGIRAMAAMPARDRAYLGRRGIAYVRTYGTLERMIDGYERSFQEVLAERRNVAVPAKAATHSPMPAELGASG